MIIEENQPCLVLKTKIEYSDIFSKQVEKQWAVTLIFDQLLEKRKILEKQKNKDLIKIHCQSEPSDPYVICSMFHIEWNKILLLL